MMEARTLLRTAKEQLCQNLRTTSLGQNLLVLIKQKACISILVVSSVVLENSSRSTRIRDRSLFREIGYVANIFDQFFMSADF